MSRTELEAASGDIAGGAIDVPTALARLLALGEASARGARWLVAIAGGSCSGKTTLASLASRRWAERGVAHAVIELDDYYRDAGDPALPRDARGRAIYDAPEALHLDELRKHLEDLLAGRGAAVPVYDRAGNRRVGLRRVEASGPLVLEGLFAIDVAPTTWPSRLAIFVEASSATRCARRVARDRASGVPEGVIVRAFRERVEPAYRRLVLPQQARADLVVTTELGASTDHWPEELALRAPR